VNYLSALKEIKSFIFDVDGVLTDSTVMGLEDGQLLRKMNVRDGYALQLAVRKGYFVGIITGGKSQGVVKRLRNLGIETIYYGISDKKEALEEIIELYNLSAENIAYMGDDMPDYEVMRQVGIPACPANAAPEIKQLSRYIAPENGGEGCVRSLIEKTLKIAGDWNEEEGKNIRST